MEYEHLLREWGLESFISTFCDEGIDDESFNLLDEATIATLFTKIGPRLIFKSKFWKYKAAMNPSVVNFTTETSENSSHSEPASSISTCETPSYVFAPDEELNVVLNDAIDEMESGVSGDSNTTASHNEGPSMKKRKISCFAKYGSLEKLLTSSAEGRGILMHKNKLNNSLRASLVKIVINELISCCEGKKYKINSTQFINASDEICELFPGENRETYFIPYFSSKLNKTRQSARGKLWSKFVNIRAALRIIYKSEESQEQSENENASGPNENDSLEKLKTCTEPYHKVLILWEDTYIMRKNKYASCPIEDVINTFPCLRQKFGADLLESDFNQIYPSCIDHVYKYFPNVTDAILAEIKERKVSLDFTSSDVERQLQGILALPYLFSPITLRKNNKDKNVWRPSRAEIQESFFFHLEDIGHMQERLDRRRTQLARFGYRLQPFAVAVGALNSIRSYYVFIDENTYYSFESTIRTLEILYKVFHALNLEYPPESKHIWLFIQEIIFKTPASSKCSSTSCVLGDITYQLNKIAENN